MAIHLLTWNPERWPWETFNEGVSRMSRGAIVEMEWATGNTKKIARGERLFLLRQGPRCPGLIGSGIAVREVRSGPHFDEARRVSGDTALFTVIRFDQLLSVEDVLDTKTLKSQQNLSSFDWRPIASGWALPPRLEAPLEELWAKHLIARGHPLLDLHTRFRSALEYALDTRPRRTPKGVLLSSARVARFGTGVGSHGATTFWIYARHGSDLELWFGFHENFTPNDLICQIVQKGGVPHGEGVTIQFVGSESIELDSVGGFRLHHNGRMTIGDRNAWDDLAQFIESTSPAEAEAFGKFRSASTWRFRVGTTAAIDVLLDRLFDYAFVIEQAKRTLNHESRLPSPPSCSVSEGSRSRRGQGYSVDTETKLVVELYAMKWAREHFESLGYIVDDHSARAPYDLIARKGSEEIWIEVKGTQGDGTAVLLTANEVEHARSHQPHVALVVVSSIEIIRTPTPIARAGQISICWPWDPDEHALVPTAYRCQLLP